MNSPLNRALEVLTKIGQYGPIKLSKLGTHTDIPKSALHRICAQLEQEGWIRKRVADKAVMLTNSFESLFATAHFSLYEADILAEQMLAIKSSAEFHVTLSMLRDDRRFSDIESTKPLYEWCLDHSIVSSSAFLAAQSILPLQERFKMIAAHIKHLDPLEASIISSGRHAKRLAQIKSGVWDYETPSINFGLISKMGSTCAISFEPITGSKIESRRFFEKGSLFEKVLFPDLKKALCE